MKEHNREPFGGQGSRHLGSRYQAGVITYLCYQFIRPLLRELAGQMDRRLVQTFLDV